MKAVYSLYLEPVAESENRELVTSLKSAAPGYDNLRRSILKYVFVNHMYSFNIYIYI